MYVHGKKSRKIYAKVRQCSFLGVWLEVIKTHILVFVLYFAIFYITFLYIYIYNCVIKLKENFIKKKRKSSLFSEIGLPWAGINAPISASSSGWLGKEPSVTLRDLSPCVFKLLPQIAFAVWLLTLWITEKFPWCFSLDQIWIPSTSTLKTRFGMP